MMYKLLCGLCLSSLCADPSTTHTPSSRASAITSRVFATSRGQSKPAKDACSTPAYPLRHVSEKWTKSAPLAAASRICAQMVAQLRSMSWERSNWQVARVRRAPDVRPRSLWPVSPRPAPFRSATSSVRARGGPAAAAAAGGGLVCALSAASLRAAVVGGGLMYALHL